jgi:hypothetical protein
MQEQDSGRVAIAALSIVNLPDRQVGESAL